MELDSAGLRIREFIRGSLICLFVTFFCTISLAQVPSEKETLYKNAQENLYSNPEKSITISEYIINNNSSVSEKSRALNLKAQALIIQGKYIFGLNTLLECVNLNSKSEDAEQLIVTNLILSDLYRQVGVMSKAEETLQKAESLLAENKFADQRKAGLKLHFTFVKSSILLEQKKQKEAIALLENNLSSVNLSEITKTSPYIVCRTYNQLSRAHLSTFSPDSARYYIDESLRISEEFDLGESFGAYAKLESSKIHFYKKDIPASLNSMRELLPILDNISDNVLKKNIHQLLADVYKENQNNANYQSHNLKYIELNESINTAQQKTRDLILSLSDDNSGLAEINDDFKMNYILMGALILVLFLLGGVLRYRHQTKLKYNYYKEYINKLKSREKIDLYSHEEKETAAEISKIPQIIPEKTELILLEKLNKFENGIDFTQRNLTLNSLAKDLETNTRYLSEIINKHKQKNFNTYINELRVNYIIQKLRTEPQFLNYKISYLAEECGFSSHTSFSTVFKSVTEISPKEFINFLKKEYLILENQT